MKQKYGFDLLTKSKKRSYMNENIKVIPINENIDNLNVNNKNDEDKIKLTKIIGFNMNKK